MKPVSDSDDIRMPAVANAFYPENEKELGKMVDNLLKASKKRQIKGEIIGMISPHAGYVFSGGVAAQGFKQLEGRDFDSVIILGISHRVYAPVPSIYLSGKFRTPLGDVDIDSGLASEIKARYPQMSDDKKPHLYEHSIEVQIPFLQRVLKKLKIVPIVLSSDDVSSCDKLARAIRESIGKKRVLVVASSDMSHFPGYDDAVKVDNTTIRLIEKMDAEKLLIQEASVSKSGVAGLDTYLCGLMPVLTVLKYAKLAGAKAEVIEYKNSGDTSYGGKDRVVGYCSVIFTK